MQKRTTFLIIIAHFLMVSCANSKDFVLYKKDAISPIIYYQNGAKSVAQSFATLFTKFGSNLAITDRLPKANATFVQLVINAKTSGFNLQQQENSFSIIGATEWDLMQGVRYFFSTYTALNAFTENEISLQQATITVPEGLSYKSNEIIAYKEPYFAENFSKEFRLWNNTNTLEETWGLWGHNIGKLIKVTPNMYAIVDGEPNEEQLNFSSLELQNALEAAIATKLADEPLANKFMIMPYDTELVCQCKQCIAAGNTKTNASPAVFELINKLASKFPSASFFSTAYISTETPPIKPVKPNVGVMVSTMSFPKGVVLESSNKAVSIIETLKRWKKITNNIYLWDYAINFDNYFDAYPTITIAQKNIQFYIKNGVTGVFMHGSDEGSFVAFGDLKAYLYAQLLNNPNVDVKHHIKLFLSKKYPAFGDALADYYLKIEDEALNNKRTLDIYGGTKNAVNKYLNYIDLNNILTEILNSRNKVKPKDKKASDILLMSLVFQSLELLRTSGIAENGYATYVNGKIKLNSTINEKLTLLAQLSAATGINKYNEIGFTISDYIKAWNERIIAVPYENLFYQHPFKVTSKLDDDYADAKVLNDGTIGFRDYYNNWLINSAPTLSIATTTAGLTKASVLQMDFLYDKKHRLYVPESITVYIGERNYQVILGEKEEAGTTRKIVRASIPLKINANDSTIRIEIKKQADKQKRSMACDEIIFR